MDGAIDLLRAWDGSHGIDQVEPTLYYRLLFETVRNAMADEIGEEVLEDYLRTFFSKNTHRYLVKNDSSLWWDDVSTDGIIETRGAICAQALIDAVYGLEYDLGEDIATWTWGKMHQIEHPHPLGAQKPLDKLFNVGPYPVASGDLVINKLDFNLATIGDPYIARGGPAMRIIIDFADVEKSVSINPTGQSGYFMDDHYQDQTQMYINGEFRKQMMNKQEILDTQKGHLVLEPSN